MDEIIKKYASAFEYMDGMSVYEVRNIARECGVRSPTTEKKNELIANIELPVHTQGTFIWNGKEYPLTSGKQMIRVALNE